MIDISALREREVKGTLTVTELNNFIKNLFDGNRTLSAVSVSGEISNLTDHRSGHMYFSLKDSDAQIRAVMFRSQRARLKFTPEAGMRVVLHGSVSVYPQTGAIQIYVNSMEPDGIGALYLAYEQMKARLLAEGLFDEVHKKPIPQYPRRIGVITSPTGAAVRDIINVTGRRYPMAQLYLYPSLVQGEGAEASLIRALDYLDKSGLVDVIIIGRGGGSIEDLWAFNSEQLARHIFAAEVPIISAVGHETDFTICDFVADMRAPTPSAAAELAVPDVRELLLRLDGVSDRLERALDRGVEKARERLEGLLSHSVLSSPLLVVEEQRTRVEEQLSAAHEAIADRLHAHVEALRLNSEKANALSPLAVLGRGYAIAENEGGIISTCKNTRVGEIIRVTLSDGKVDAEVTKIGR